jgi:hypothetical protein
MSYFTLSSCSIGPCGYSFEYEGGSVSLFTVSTYVVESCGYGSEYERKSVT